MDRVTMLTPGIVRACPFCNGVRAARYGARMNRIFHRCLDCGSIFQTLDEAAYKSLHSEVFTDEGFIQRQLLQQAPEPSHAIWRSIPRPAQVGRMLEVGPGTGHLMAAAADTGWEVSGVEHSSIHREFINKFWKHSQVFASLGDLPQGRRFNLIVMINVLEHVFDLAKLLAELKDLLEPNGEIFISAPNAESLVAKLAGTRWSMFKPADHISLPSSAGLKTLGKRVGLAPQRVWSTELPFETLFGLLIALRDNPRREVLTGVSMEEGIVGVNPGGGLKHRIMRAINTMDGRWEPTNRIIGWSGWGSSIKTTYRLAES